MKIFNKKVTPKFLTLAIIGCLLALFALLVGTLEVTSQPIFCSSCHYMRDYYNQWKVSSHKKVPCLECHAKPGLNNYLRRKFEAIHEVVSMITGKYPPRPHAEVDDASCLRQGCHEKRLLSGKVNFKGVQFDHANHLTQKRRDRQLRCTSCHAQMAMGRHIAVTEEVCFLCHFKDRMHTPAADSPAFCLKCHTVPDSAITIRGTEETFNHSDYLKRGVQCTQCHEGIVRGNGDVPKIVCFQCHNKPENLSRFNDTVFIHENHITKHKVECYFCHTQIEHTLNPPEKTSLHDASGKCAGCHGNGHLASELLYSGTGARGVSPVQSSMHRAHVTCNACHRVIDKDTSFLVLGSHFPRADKTACMKCHGDDGATYLADWNNQLTPALASASRALAEAEKTMGNKPSAQKTLEDARFNIDLVKQGRGVHNIEYSMSILKATVNALKKDRDAK
jgi:nitrate/TMAO reductase-like tetraheme cytochrome c subunit